LTRAQLVELHDAWLKQAYNLQADIGGKTRGARLLKGTARACAQTHAQTLSSCAADLQKLIELPHDEKHR